MGVIGEERRQGYSEQRCNHKKDRYVKSFLEDHDTLVLLCQFVVNLTRQPRLLPADHYSSKLWITFSKQIKECESARIEEKLTPGTGKTALRSAQKRINFNITLPIGTSSAFYIVCYHAMLSFRWFAKDENANDR